MQYKLSFTKIYSFPEFMNDIDIKDDWKGIYVWGFRLAEHDNKFLAYYVGRHYTSIINRVKLHHNKHIPFETHNIYKEEYLPYFYKHALYKKPLNDDLYKEYKDKFAFLNADHDWKAINIPKISLSKSERNILQPHIDNYINNFYVCCIQVNDLSYNMQLSIKDEKQLIANLERHVQENIPHTLSTKKIGLNFPDFDIDTSNLGDDNFFSTEYKKMTIV